MNAHFDFGSERRDRVLPIAFTGDAGDDRMSGRGRDLALAGPAAVEHDRPKFQDQFFKYLGLALKHRWLILACGVGDRKSTRLNSSHSQISYAVFCLKKRKT